MCVGVVGIFVVVMHIFVQFFSYDPEILHLCSPPYAVSLINFWWRAGRSMHAFSVKTLFSFNFLAMILKFLLNVRHHKVHS